MQDAKRAGGSVYATEEVSEGTLATCWKAHAGLIGVCLVGTVCQMGLLAAHGAVLEYCCVVVYAGYNCVAMVIVRIMNLAFHFEHKALLAMTARFSTTMFVYDVAIATTVSSFDLRLAVKLMSIAGLLNVVVVIPAVIREFTLLLDARRRGLDVGRTRPLDPVERCFVNGFLIVDNSAYLLELGLALCILATQARVGPLWRALLYCYVSLNVLPLFVTKVVHLVETETRLCTIQVMIAHFYLVVGTCCVMVPTLALGPRSKTLQADFALVGVANGAVTSLAMAFTSLATYFRPRVHSSSSSHFHKEDSHAAAGGLKSERSFAASSSSLSSSDLAVVRKNNLQQEAPSAVELVAAII